MDTVCYVCGSKMTEKEIEVMIKNIDNNITVKSKIYVCDKCGKIIFSQKEIDQLIKISKQLTQENKEISIIKYCDKCKCSMEERVQTSMFGDKKIYICPNCGNIEVGLYAEIS
jgi:YgiT-type zinc finger domain-containing protein